MEQTEGKVHAGVTKPMWMRTKNWVSLNLFKQPVRQQRRQACEHHAAGCYLCPREYCSGALNDRDDPDLTKPRPSSSGHCVYLSGASGGLRLRMSARGANEHYARQALERGYSDISTPKLLTADIDRVDQHNALEVATYRNLEPRYTLPNFDQSLRGKLMQLIVDRLHKNGD